MSVAELPPPPAGEDPPPKEPITPCAPTGNVAPKPAIRDVCKNCMRPVFADCLDGVTFWRHWDPRVDMPSSEAFCLPELYVPPQVNWGHLDVGSLKLAKVAAPSPRGLAA